MKKTIRSILHHIGILGFVRKLRSKIFPNQWEKLQAQEFKKRIDFYGGFIKKGDLCFDVGANIGNRTEIFIALGAEVVAVEPQESCINVLNKKFKNKIHLITKGLGGKEEELPFYEAESSVYSSFSKSWVETGRFPQQFDSRNVKIMQLTTLDKLISQFGVPVFCKIDVEGYELEVFKGLTKPLKIVSFEYNVPHLTENMIDCINYLKSLGSILCNYSKHESMKFELTEWISPVKMIDIIRSEEFTSTHWGDIYVKFN
ncbi:MAG: FkbM family methyltransferase [Bacteroidia bacterium]